MKLYEKLAMRGRVLVGTNVVERYLEVYGGMK
jgi:hypothetical protein